MIDSTVRSLRQVWALIFMVALDASLKLVAYHFLDPTEPVHDCTICISLAVNPLNLGSAGQSLVSRQGLGVLLESAVFAATMSFLLLVLAAKGRLTKGWIVLSIVGALITSLTIGVVAPATELSSYTTLSALGRAAQTFLWLVVWALATSPFWKVGALLFATAGLSNSLSLIYPPYAIVDYFWSTPLNQMTGMGVFNFADILWLLAFPIFGIALIRSIVIRALHNRK